MFRKRMCEINRVLCVSLCTFKVAFAENEMEEIETDNCEAVMVTDSDKVDYLLEDKPQIVSIVDFRNVPRNEIARQQARRELVIQMLIAESMTKWDKLYKRLKHEEKAKRRMERHRLGTCGPLHSSASTGSCTSSISTSSSCRSLLSSTTTSSDFNPTNNNKLSIINDISFNYKWRHTLKHCMGKGPIGGSRGTLCTLRESVCSSSNDLHIWHIGPLLLTPTCQVQNIVRHRHCWHEWKS